MFAIFLIIGISDLTCKQSTIMQNGLTNRVNGAITTYVGCRTISEWLIVFHHHYQWVERRVALQSEIDCRSDHISPHLPFIFKSVFYYFFFVNFKLSSNLFFCFLIVFNLFFVLYSKKSKVIIGKFSVLPSFCIFFFIKIILFRFVFNFIVFSLL